MSAAQSESVDPTAKKARKKREIQRRFVVSIPEEVRLYLRENHKEANQDSEQGLARLMMYRGLRASGVTPQMLRARYAEFVKECAEKRAAEAAEQVGEGETGLAVADEDYDFGL